MAPFTSTAVMANAFSINQRIGRSLMLIHQPYMKMSTLYIEVRSIAGTANFLSHLTLQKMSIHYTMFNIVFYLVFAQNTDCGYASEPSRFYQVRTIYVLVQKSKFYHIKWGFRGHTFCTFHGHAFLMRLTVK